MEYQLISHALDKPLKLWEHINQVVRASIYLVSQKSLHFSGISKGQIEDLCILVAACHDFGKSTLFFQEYINILSDGNEYRGNTKDKSHALISAFFGYYMAENWVYQNQLDDHWRLFLPFAVFEAIEGHHGTYKCLEDILKMVAKNFSLLEKQLNQINPEIFDYQFYDIVFKNYSDFDINTIKDISTELRRLHRTYEKVPTGYDKESWLDTQIEHRILALFLYSILLEADKAYLASGDPSQYERESIHISDDLVDKYLMNLEKSKLIDNDRNRAYKETILGVTSFPLTERIHSITLPTGLGKTLLSTSWAIKLRERIKIEDKFYPKIIVSLPFLSIIEQTDQTYKKVLGELYRQHKDRLYITSYSISNFEYHDSIDDLERSDNSIDFFLNIWNAEIIVSTFDQLLYSLFSLKSKHLLRFHNLFNSIIIFDEVQALPSELWKPFEKFFEKLSDVGHTHILLMSATQPGFLPDAIERVPNHETYFENRRRVELQIYPEKKQLNSCIMELLDFLNKYADNSIMIVLNTRESSKLVLRELKSVYEHISGTRTLFYLSSLVAPSQRSDRILDIKKSLDSNDNPIIITTQCIEAGVDIDVDYIVRDWAPLDSIFQVCGRCNRNGEKEIGYVILTRLESDKGKAFSEMIYDSIELESTAISLSGHGLKVDERQFYSIGALYFEMVREHLGQSMKIVNAYAQYSHTYEKNGTKISVDIKRLLRGDEYQEHFIIPSLDENLKEDLQKAMVIEDRWQRRYAVKRLKKRIAANSVSISFPPWALVRPDNLEIDKIGYFRILNKQFYDDTDKYGVGLNVDLRSPVGGSITISWDNSDDDEDQDL